LECSGRLDVIRRSTLLVALGVAVVTGATAAVIVLVVGSGSKATMTPAQYLARASAVCRFYQRKLDGIPPPTLGSTVAVAASVGRALPVLEQQAVAVRKIRPPKALEERVRVFFQHTDHSLADLRGVLAAARRGDLKTMGPKFFAWIDASNAAREASHRVGYRCSQP
jgi:hypothetical protein